jgi:HUS1 checkpoint protein
MKFKAKIRSDKLPLLLGLVGGLEKVGTAFVVYLSPDSLKLAVPISAPDQVRAFADLQQAQVFCEYRIESQSENCILFEVESTMLSTALSSGKEAPLIHMKLAKRAGQACLVIETRAREIDIVHDLPIKVMRATDICHYMLPEVPPPDVQLELPLQRSVRTVVERMKGIAKYLHIDAEMGGQLVLRAETDDATIKTYYTQLVPNFNGMEDEDESRDRRASVKVDSKRLAQVMNLYAMSIETVICCLIVEHCLVLHVFLHPQEAGTCTFYQPVYKEE